MRGNQRDFYVRYLAWEFISLGALDLRRELHPFASFKSMTINGLELQLVAFHCRKSLQDIHHIRLPHVVRADEEVDALLQVDDHRLRANAPKVRHTDS